MLALSHALAWIFCRFPASQPVFVDNLQRVGRCVLCAGAGLGRSPVCCLRESPPVLQDNDDHILIRVALAVMEELQEELLTLHNFEAIITHLKVGGGCGPYTFLQHA